MFDLMDYADYHDEQNTLLFLDNCKGFDISKQKLIFKVFESCGYYDNFLSCLKTIYNTPKCCNIINNCQYMPFFFKV